MVTDIFNYQPAKCGCANLEKWVYDFPLKLRQYRLSNAEILCDQPSVTERRSRGVLGIDLMRQLHLLE